MSQFDGGWRQTGLETDKFETEMVDGWRLESDDLVVFQTSDSLMLQTLQAHWPTLLCIILHFPTTAVARQVAVEVSDSSNNMQHCRTSVTQTLQTSAVCISLVLEMMPRGSKPHRTISNNTDIDTNYVKGFCCRFWL